MRLTALSAKLIREADSFEVVTMTDGECYVLVWRSGRIAQLYAGDGPMFYSSPAAAIRAVNRINPACTLRRVGPHFNPPASGA